MATLLRRMPKMKTHSGAKKRFRITKGGKGKKAVARHAGKTHILQKKSPKRKRQMDNAVVVADADLPRVKAMLGKK
ncbi:MAG: large subunit ribosomal protein [Thermoleophilaceae bacterium]|nr:large subunit ribosomal protein [Thermoleophilaceae bacterium]